MRTSLEKAVYAAAFLQAFLTMCGSSPAQTLDPQCIVTGTVETAAACVECHLTDMDFSMATAAPSENKADECAFCHVDESGFTTDNANFHHVEGMRKARLAGSFIDCLECHTLSGQQEGYYLVNEPYNCFLNCHTPSFTRDPGRYFIRLTGAMFRENGWDISGMAERKMGEAHHFNYASDDYKTGNCYRCHSFEWDPERNAQVTAHVPGSAGSPQDVNNILLRVSPGLVHAVNPGGTLSLSAADTQGDIKTVRWSINNQPISYGEDFDYTFKWAAAGDTYVVKLEVWSWDNRYARQNIVVNVH